ncbi:uncharacterized protein PAC_14178 [Phialocephala subalpina]|uniref:Uncharacterized protein n=1 Tax=Phialocephala subalpina TaxID=576137 RepID=A0A1L7XGW8_9HELO|nr:uncharacterized protein PAC_14178 [Phialocephala subalpina]
MAIVTPDSAIRVKFHSNVVKLYQKTQEPSAPVNYRGRQYLSTEDYVLLHEEEQHLADGIAVLAHSKVSPNCVSAVMLEQSFNPPSLVVRLASNKTPSLPTVKELRNLLNITADYARAGKDSERYQARLLTQILTLSKDRLLVRLRSKHSTGDIWPPSKRANGTPLHKRIDGLLENISVLELNTGVEPLRGHLLLLRQSLIDTENATPDELMEALRVAVIQSWELSHLNGSRSLETQLQNLGATSDIYQNRIVLDIDKISRHFDICKDLMRFSRRSKSRAVFSDIRLEACTAPPTSIPPGSRVRCPVHGEVQLILYYEQHPTDHLPRCIGSSKSACFLCDRFIANHGRYHISHSHMHLHERWTVPMPLWMSPQQRARFEEILGAMNDELVRLLQEPRRIYTNSPESLAHMLILPEGAIASPTTTSIVSQAKLPSLKEITTPKASSSTLTLSTVTSSGLSLASVYYLDSLPLSINIRRATKLCTLLVHNISYIFDLEDVKFGQLQVSEHVDVQTDVSRINTRDLASDSDVAVRDEKDERMLTFCVHDNNRHELRIEIQWTNNRVQ